MSRFANLKEDIAATKAPSEPPIVGAEVASKKGNPGLRAGKKGIAGFFSPELSRAINIMAIEESTTVQALMGEAFDLLMRSRGKHAFGER